MDSVKFQSLALEVKFQHPMIWGIEESPPNK